MTVITPTSLAVTSEYYIFGQLLENTRTGSFGYSSGTNTVPDFLPFSALGNYYVLSFYARSNVTGVHSGSIGSPNYDAAYVFTYNISSADTWEFKQIQIPPTAIGFFGTGSPYSARILWCLGAGTDRQTATINSWIPTSVPTALWTGSANNVMATAGNYLSLATVQLELDRNSGQATPYQFEPFDIALYRAQRWYQRSYSYGVLNGSSTTGSAGGTTQAYSPGAVNNFYFSVKFPVPMLSNNINNYQTIIYSPDTGASGFIRNATLATDVAASVGSSGDMGFIAQTTGTVAANTLMRFHWVSYVPATLSGSSIWSL